MNKNTHKSIFNSINVFLFDFVIKQLGLFVFERPYYWFAQTDVFKNVWVPIVKQTWKKQTPQTPWSLIFSFFFFGSKPNPRIMSRYRKKLQLSHFSKSLELQHVGWLTAYFGGSNNEQWHNFFQLLLQILIIKNKIFSIFFRRF